MCSISRRAILERAADFDETPDGHAVSYDQSGNLIGLTLVGVRPLLDGARGHEEIALALPRKVEPSTDPDTLHTPLPLTSANLVPAEVKLADLELTLT